MHSHDHKFIYVHIPKSVRHIYQALSSIKYRADKENNQNQQDYDGKYRTTCERAIGGILHEVPDYKDYFKFTIARNPLIGWFLCFHILRLEDYFVENNIDSPKSFTHKSFMIFILEMILMALLTTLMNKSYQ